MLSPGSGPTWTARPTPWGWVLDKGRDEYFKTDMLGKPVFFYLWAAETPPDDGSLAGLDNKTVADQS